MAEKAWEYAEEYYKGTNGEQNYEKALLWYEEAAKEGNAEAEFKIGFMNEKGYGCEEDLQKACEWYRKSAEHGSPNGQYFLAAHLYYGSGILRDLQQAFIFLKKAAQNGNTHAQAMLIDAYLEQPVMMPADEYTLELIRTQCAAKNSKAVTVAAKMALSGKGPFPAEEAVKLLKAAAEQGDKFAMFYLANALERGIGTEADDQEALAWLKKSAELDYAEAMYKLSNTYEAARGVRAAKPEQVIAQMTQNRKGDAVKGKAAYDFLVSLGEGEGKDPQSSLDLLEKAASKGHAESAYKLSMLGLRGLVKSIDEKKAVEYMERAVVRGFIPAQMDYGTMLLEGKKVAKDEQKGFFWLNRAASYGVPMAEAIVGMCYARGTGTEKDEEKALQIWMRAADHGSAEAMNNIAVLKSQTATTDEEKEEVEKWITKAAEHGFIPAMRRMGYKYERGLGVEVNEGEAYNWFQKAAQKGDMTAQYDCGRLLVKSNPQGAIGFFTMAARQGHPDAICYLGMMADRGIGMERDAEQAWKFFETAARANYLPAAEALAAMSSEKGSQPNAAKHDFWVKKVEEMKAQSAKRA